MKEERLPTFIKGFDKLIEGGLIKESITLISGGPGTGKSIFCMQVLYNNALKGKKCLYISFEQPIKKLMKQMQKFNWNYSKIKNKLDLKFLPISDPMLEISLWDALKAKNYDLVCIDSLSAITETIVPMKEEKLSLSEVQEKVLPFELTAEEVARIKINRVFDYLQDAKVTALVIGETIEGETGYSRDKTSDFLCDGIVKLTTHKALDTRKIEIAKMRNTKHTLKPQTIEITTNGLILK